MLRGAIALTDQDWFEFLRREAFSEAINFWTPTPWRIRQLIRGDRFCFFLKQPHRKISGGGTFVKYSEMTIQRAWERYGIGNGCENIDALKGKIKNFLGRPLTIQLMDHKIGCIELIDCKFLTNPRFVEPSKFAWEVPRTLQKWKIITVGDNFEDYLNTHGSQQKNG